MLFFFVKSLSSQGLQHTLGIHEDAGLPDVTLPASSETSTLLVNHCSLPQGDLEEGILAGLGSRGCHFSASGALGAFRFRIELLNKFKKIIYIPLHDIGSIWMSTSM